MALSYYIVDSEVKHARRKDTNKWVIYDAYIVKYITSLNGVACYQTHCYYSYCLELANRYNRNKASILCRFVNAIDQPLTEGGNGSLGGKKSSFAVGVHMLFNSPLNNQTFKN